MVVALLATLLVSTPQAVAAAPWTNAGNMSVPRVGHTATKLPNGRVLVVGGTNFNGNNGYEFHRSAEAYDPATNSWKRVAGMTTARTGHSATLLPDGKVLVVGGLTSDGETSSALSSAELYDPATGQWSFAGALSVARADHAATLLDTGFVLFTGGQHLDEFGTTVNLKSAEIYSFETGFGAVQDMAVAHMGHTATLMQDGSVLVVGGQNEARELQRIAERYVSGEGWTSAGSLEYQRSDATAHLLPNGSVIVAGGYTGSFGVAGDTPITEVYTPGSGWALGTPLYGSRFGYTMTMMAYGQMFVVGGYTFDGDTYLASTTTGGVGYSFSESTALAEARAQHVAVLLNDGSVLVVGGFGSTDVLSSAERWIHSYYSPEISKPATTLKTGTLGASGVVANVTWTVVSPNYESMHHFDVELRTNGGTWQVVTLSEPAPLSIDVPVQPGARYQVRVRGIDRVGGIGNWSYGDVFNVRGIQESDSRIAYSSGWKNGIMGRAWGGSVKHHSAANATTTFAFDGATIAFVTTKGPDRGRAQILIDGVVKKTVDLYSPTLRPASVVFAQNGLAAGLHTVQVKILSGKNASSKGTRVDVDGFVVIN